MSTITVVKKNGQAAIAADSMTKWGSQKEAAAYVINHDKILQVNGSYLAATGPTAAKLVLRDYFAGLEGDPALDSVERIFQTWVTLHQVLRERYFLPHPIAGQADQISFAFHVPVDRSRHSGEPLAQCAHVQALQALLIEQLDGHGNNPIAGECFARHGLTI